MKNFFALLSTLLLLGTGPIASAQTQSFAWGVTGGINLSRIIGNDRSFPLRAGYRAGIASEYRFSSRWALAGEIAYSNQDFTEEMYSSPTSNPTLIHYQNRYVILPLLLRFSTRRSAFLLETGPQVMRHLPQNGIVERQLGLGWTLGAGYRLGRHVVAGIRFTQDVLSRVKPSEIEFTDTSGNLTRTETLASTYNQVLSANLTYFF